MKRAFAYYGAALVVATLAASPAVSEGPDYDPAKEVTLKGIAVEVLAKPDWMGPNGVNVTLKTPEGKLVHVDLAPVTFLDLLDIKLAAGDDLEVVGCWGVHEGVRVLLARQVRNENVILAVRSPSGQTVW